MEDTMKVTYSKTDTPGVWQLYLQSSISAMFDHLGYVYADEAGQFSLLIYPTEEDARTDLHLYNNQLTQWALDPEEHTFE